MIKFNSLIIPILAICTGMSAPLHAQSWDGYFYGATVSFGTGTYQQGVSALDEVGPEVEAEGGMFGLRGGMNIQSGKTVYGFDAELSTGIGGLVEQGNGGPDWFCGSGDCTVNIDALLTLRGRYGMTFSPETLGYAAAGLAVGAVQGGIENSNQEGSSTAVGYTVAIGVEQMVSPSISVFGELGYYDLGDLEFGDDGGGEAYDGVGDFSAVKIGVNVQF